MSDAGELIKWDMTTLPNLEETQNTKTPFLYGTLSYGVDTWWSAFEKEKYGFSYNSRLRSEHISNRTNYHRTDWTTYPDMDLFIFQNNKIDKFHNQWMEDWGHQDRDEHVLLIHGVEFITSL